MRPRHSLSRDNIITTKVGRRHRPDYWIVIWSILLLSIGLIVVYAISPALSQTYKVPNNYYVYKQLIAIALSIVAFIITYKVPLSWWKQAYKPLIIVAIIATLLALVLPVNPSYPAHRWVRLGSFSFQSVELVKFALLIYISGFLAKRIKDGTIKSARYTLKPLGYIFLVTLFVVAVIQSDLGSAGVIIAMIVAMAFVAGMPLGKIGIGLAVVLICAGIAISTSPYRLQRLETYLHPQSNCQGSGYQACQALIAVGSGGIAGLGLGNSVQAYGYLPEAENDSIFAIYAEKFGFIGSAILVVIFMAFFSRLKTVAERSSDEHTRLIVIGVLAWLSVQTLINVGAMIGLLPLKGITLPFISYGGTSVVFVTAAIGLVFQASQYTTYGEIPETNSERISYRRNMLRRTSY